MKRPTKSLFPCLLQLDHLAPIHYLLFTSHHLRIFTCLIYLYRNVVIMMLDIVNNQSRKKSLPVCKYARRDCTLHIVVTLHYSADDICAPTTTVNIALLFQSTIHVYAFGILHTRISIIFSHISFS